MTSPPTQEEQAPATISAAELQRGAARGFAWTLVNIVLSTPVAVAVNAVVARYLGTANYGRLATLTVAIGLMSQLTNFGVSDATIQWGASAHALGNRRQVDRLLSTSLGYHMFVMLPLALTGALMLARGSSPIVLAALVVGTTLPAALGSAALCISIENRTAAAAKIALISNLVIQTVVLLTAWASHSASGVWSARMAAGGLLLPLNFIVLDRARRGAAARLAVPRRMPNGYWRYCAYATASGLVATLVTSRSEVLILGAWKLTVAAGLFSLAYGLSKQVTAPVDAIAGPLIPAITGLLTAHADQATQALLRVTRVASMLSSIIVAVAVPGVFASIPLLYGKAYGNAGWPFVVLAITSCLESVIAPLYVFTRARRRNDLVLKIGLAALAVDVSAAILGIPHQPLLGAVVANALGLLTALVLLATVETRAHGVRLSDFVLALSPMAAATIAGVSASAITVMLSATPLLALASGPAVGYTAFLALVRLLPIPTGKSDIESSLRSLSGRAATLALRMLTPLTPR